MELWTTLRVLVRRWYVVLPCLAITALVAVQLAGDVKPTYKAEGTVVFLRPLQPPDAASSANNPWQTVDYSLNQFALLMGQAATSEAFQGRVAAGGGSTTFSVTTSATQMGSPTNQTPTLILSVTADTPEAAMASYDVLSDALDQEVKDRQRSVGAPESTWITAVDLTIPPGAQELVGSRVTVLIAVAIAGSLVSLGLVFVLDALLLARRHRRGAATNEGSSGGDDPTREPAADVAADGGAEVAATPAVPVRLAPAPEPVIADGERRPRTGVDGPAGHEDADVNDLTLDDLSLDDLLEDWGDERPPGPRRPAIPGDARGGAEDVDEAVGQ